MKKAIRILEVPIYLLIIAAMCTEYSWPLHVFLTIASLARLIVNVIADEYIYKNKK